jgi:hypothetical protein
LAERTAWVFGLVCLGTWGALYIEGVMGARHGLERFAALQAAALQQTDTPDLSLWDRERVSAWRLALSEPAPPPVAVLRIAKIRLEVPVLPAPTTSRSIAPWVTSTERRCRGRMATPESPGTATGSSEA